MTHPLPPRVQSPLPLNTRSRAERLLAAHTAGRRMARDVRDALCHRVTWTSTTGRAMLEAALPVNKVNSLGQTENKKICFRWSCRMTEKGPTVQKEPFQPPPPPKKKKLDNIFSYSPQKIKVKKNRFRRPTGHNYGHLLVLTRNRSFFLGGLI